MRKKQEKERKESNLKKLIDSNQNGFFEEALLDLSPQEIGNLGPFVYQKCLEQRKLLQEKKTQKYKATKELDEKGTNKKIAKAFENSLENFIKAIEEDLKVLESINQKLNKLKEEKKKRKEHEKQLTKITTI
jgi:monoamine oxidase